MGTKTKKTGSPKTRKALVYATSSFLAFIFKARDKKVHWTFLFSDWVNRNLLLQ